MNSNHTIAQFLEEKLLRHGSTIAELREFATTCGVDLTIQADDIWLSRPGLSQAIRLDLPSRDIDWGNGEVHVRIQSIANDLWNYEDRLETILL